MKNLHDSDNGTPVLATSFKRIFPRFRIALSFRTALPTLGILAVVLVVAGAVTRDTDPIELDLFTVSADTFRVELELDGRVEPVRSNTVSSECTWSTRILSIVPEGTWVQKGDVVCVLDSAELEEYLRSREVPLIRSRANLDASVQDEALLRTANERRLSQAEFAFTTAANQLEAYQFGTHPQQVSKMEEDLHLLEEQLFLAEDEFQHTEKLWSEGFASQRALDQTSYTLLQRQEAVRKLRGELDLLKRFQHPRSAMQLEFAKTNAQRQILRTEIANSLAETKSRLTTLSNERRMKIYERYVEGARRNVEACTLRAPADGQVIYANSWRDLSRGRTSIEEGKNVYFRQAIFRIPDERFQKVSVNIHESLITRVYRGMPVVVRLKGYEMDEIAGEIMHVSDYARANNRYAPGELEYTLDIELKPTEEQRSIVRLNMDASVTLTLTEKKDALLIPRNTVVSGAGRSMVWVMEDKDLVAREVQLGDCNDSMVCVVGGLSEAERVVSGLTPQQTAALEERLYK